MQLLQQLANGDCAIKNDGTVEELRRVLNAAFPLEVCNAIGDEDYYKKSDFGYRLWSGYTQEPSIPAYSVKEFIAEMDFVLPEKWCVKANEDNGNVLYEWAKSQKNSKAEGLYINPYKDHFWIVPFHEDKTYMSYSDKIPKGHTRITFDQFKKYVLKEDATISKKETVEKFAVMLTDSGAPTKLHDTYESAEKECLRLVKETKRNGYVLKVVSKIVNEIKIEKV